jgi:hypothetical protein
MLTNMTRIEQLLADPTSDITLEELKVEINELAKLRDKSRVAFCKRLALVYMMIVGRPRSTEEPNDGKGKKFYEWCRRHLRSANGKEYSTSTLSKYVGVGFSADPAMKLRDLRHQANHRSERMRKLGISLEEAVGRATGPKVVPIGKLQEKYKLPTDVAAEVNTLMRAWEQASSHARAQFIYMVTGKRIAA